MRLPGGRQNTNAENPRVKSPGVVMAGGAGPCYSLGWSSLAKGEVCGPTQFQQVLAVTRRAQQQSDGWQNSPTGGGHLRAVSQRRRL